MLFDSLRETGRKGHLKGKIMKNKNASHSLFVKWKIFRNNQSPRMHKRQETTHM